MSGSSSPGTVVTLAGAALATAAGISGALIDIVGFQIGSGVIVGTPSNLASGVSSLSYPTQTGVDPSTLIAATASMLSYQVVNSNTMLFTITLDSTVGGASGFNVGNIGLYIANPGGGYQLFSLTALPAVDFKYANNPPLIGNTRYYNVAIQLTGIASAINISILNVSNYVLPTVANNAALPSVLSAASPVYIVKADSNYNGLTSLALRNSGSTGWDYIPQDFGWALAGDQSVYGVDTGTGGSYHINVVPAPTALTAGRVFRVLIAYNNTNTGNATLNVNSLGNVNILNPDGSSLYASQIVAGAISVFIYDGTNFQLMSQAHPTINKRGDTIAGNLVVAGNLSSTAVISATQASGVATGLLLQTNNQTRWYISKYSDVESGTYGGSSLVISSYDNTGTFIANVVSISRATGVVSFSSIPTAPTATLGDSSTNLATTAFIQKAIQIGAAVYAVDTGTVNSLVVTTTPSFTTYAAGTAIRVKLAATNTGNCVINPNGLGAKSILNPDGTQISAGQCIAGAILELVFDGTNFQLTSSNTSAVSTYGGTMSGLLTLKANIRADGAFTLSRGMHITTTGVERWFINGTNDAESTGNAGTNLGIARYSDTGAYIDSPFMINRATGIANFTQIPLFPTAAAGDSSTNGANTQFVENAINSASTYYVQDTGTVNALVGTTTPALSALAAGNLIKINVAHTNTSATVTVNINGLGAKNIINPDWSTPQIGQIKAGSIVSVVYDGVQFQIQSIPYTPVNRAGDTMPGALVVSGGLTSTSNMYVSGAVNTNRNLVFTTGANNRWVVNANSTTETGSGNTGSDFGITRYSDAGASIDIPFSIIRSSGAVNISTNLTVTNSIYGNSVTGASITADGAFTLSRGMHITTAGVARWFINGTNEAESTGNAGTNLDIARYSDAGAWIDNPVNISRATGIVNFNIAPTGPTVAQFNNSSSIATTAYVDRQSGAGPASSTTYAVDTSGTANTITVALTPTVASIAAGFVFRVKVANTNTSTTSLTLTLTSGSVTAVLKNPDGSVLFGGQVLAGSIVDVVYDGTYYQLISPIYAAVNKNGDTVNGALTIAGNLQTNSSLILVNSGSTSRIYTDPSTGSYGANDIVFNTGSAYTVIDSGGNLHLTGVASIAPATALTHAVSWGEFNGGTDTGTANNIHLTMAGITNYSQVAGIPITFQLANNITGASVVNINGIGNVSLLQGGSGLSGGEGVAPWNYTIVYWAGSFHITGSGAGAVNVGTPSVGTHATNVSWVNAYFATVNGSTSQVFAVANPPDGNHAPNVNWCYSNLAQIGGTTSASFYANSSSTGPEGDIGVAAAGFWSAYLYNSAAGWGLNSNQGGTIISYNRASNSTLLNGVTINSYGTMHLAQIPNHPTPPTADNSTDSATTAFVWAAIPAYIAATTPPPSGGDEGPCFLYGTPIVMADNTIKQIQMVKVGEFVLGANGEINEVLALHRPLLGKRQLVYINDDHITPADHPHTRADMKGFYSCDPEDMVNGWGHYVDVFTANGREQWRNIGISDRHLSTMHVGVELWTIDGPRVVETMDFIDAPTDTQLYNFVLGGSHTYFANGYSVTGWPNDIDFDYDTWTPTGAVYSPEIKEMEMA